MGGKGISIFENGKQIWKLGVLLRYLFGMISELVWKHIFKQIHKMLVVGTILDSILDAKMLQKLGLQRSKKYAKKRHSKKRPSGSMFYHLWELFGSYFGAKNDLRTTVGRFFKKKTA